MGRLQRTTLMAFDRVITFGDSWPAGAELSKDEQTFGQLIAKSLGVDFFNFAQSSSSIEHMIPQLQKAIDLNKHNNSLAIFFLTEYSRTIGFDDAGNPLDMTRRENIEFKDNYVRYLYNDYLGQFRANTTLLVLQSMCRYANISDYYIVGWSKFPIVLPGIDKDKIFDQGNTTCLNLFKVYDNDPTDDPSFIYYHHNHYIKPKVCHPNQQGHQKIADELLNWIQQKNSC